MCSMLFALGGVSALPISLINGGTAVSSKLSLGMAKKKAYKLTHFLYRLDKFLHNGFRRIALQYIYLLDYIYLFLCSFFTLKSTNLYIDGNFLERRMVRGLPLRCATLNLSWQANSLDVGLDRGCLSFAMCPLIREGW